MFFLGPQVQGRAAGPKPCVLLAELRDPRLPKRLALSPGDAFEDLGDASGETDGSNGLTM